MSFARLASIVLIGIAIAGCGGGSGDGIVPGGGQGAANPQGAASGGMTSLNWAGYQVAGAAGGFTRVSGTWIVPAVAPSSSDTASSSWTGIGGGCTNPPSCTTTDPTLIQAGTEEDNTSGSPNYFAWWEAIPAPAVSAGPLNSQQFPVAPGDVMHVTLDASSGAVWNIEMTDTRSGAQLWKFTTSVPYSAAGLTAEWIQESPLTAGSGGAGQLPLSNFGRVAFSGLTVNGGNPALNGGDRMTMTNSSGAVLASPSGAAAGGDSFAVCYGSAPCH